MKKKKRKLNSRGKLIIFLFSFIICSIITYQIYNIYNGNKLKETKKVTKNNIKEIITPKEESLSLVMVGDNLIHDKIYNEAKTNNSYDFTKMYSLVKEEVKNYDLAYYNQETILGGSEIGVSSYPAFNSPYEVGDAMIDAGFNLVSLATNHTLDRGEKAIINSRNYWNTKKDVLAVGSYSSEEERNELRILTKNNITYTLLNYTYGTNGIAIPQGKNYLVNVWPVTGNNPKTDTKYQNYKEQVKKDIEAVRDKVDVLIVAMHWGVEYTHEPTEYEKDMANYLASLGVNIIVGTHPHVIQPVTWIDDTLVIYSLGNFISAQYQNQSTCTNYKCTTGLMTSLDITKKVKGDKKTITIDNVNNELIYTYYRSWRNFKVIPFSNSEIANYLPGYEQVYETYKKVVQKYNNDMNVVPLNND